MCFVKKKLKTVTQKKGVCKAEKKTTDSLPFLWASVSEPAGSVLSTQSQKKRGGDYRAMASCQGMLSEG